MQASLFTDPLAFFQEGPILATPEALAAYNKELTTIQARLRTREEAKASERATETERALLKRIQAMRNCKRQMHADFAELQKEKTVEEVAEMQEESWWGIRDDLLEWLGDEIDRAYVVQFGRVIQKAKTLGERENEKDT